MIRDKRMIVMVGFISILAMSFWLGSRYPDLGVKAEAGPEMILDGIGFDVVFPVQSEDSLQLKVGKRTVNWLETNKKGMLFGLVFAAALASLVTLLGRKSLRSRLGNTFLGIAIGAPLGLCVNCAAPVATGLHRAGSRMETSLAATLASPTLNVLVLSFLFTMLPLHLAVLKVFFTILLLLSVPLLARWAQTVESEGEKDPSSLCAVEPPPSTWFRASGWAVATVSKNFWQLLWKLGPLMVLAGALGSLVISVLPLEQVGELVSPSFMTIAMMALLGTFLPVPMAFDVVICGLLYQAGMPVEYVMALLFTLGAFSVFTFEVFRQTVSARLAPVLFLLVSFLGLVSAYCAAWVDGAHKNYLDQKLLKSLTARFESQPLPEFEAPPAPFDEKSLRAQIERQKLGWQPQGGGDSDLDIRRRPFAARSEKQQRLFTREEAVELGLDLPVALTYKDQWTIPALTNRALASGDIHQDGWSDVVVANDYEMGGLTLFANFEGKFVRQSLDLGPYAESFVTVVALVDFNNDGWLDLFFATLHGENRLMINQQGSFSEILELPTLPGACVNAAGFADLDSDGDLDLVLASYVHFWTRKEYPRLWNYLVIQEQPLQFNAYALPGFGGNSHCVLLSDFDNDEKIDIALGNDWSPPDQFFKGLGGAQFVPLGGKVIPGSTEWTMSIDSADLDNDLKLETFISHIAYESNARKRVTEARAQDLPALLADNEIETVEFMREASRLHDQVKLSQDPAVCFSSERFSGWDGRDCLYDVLLSRVWREDSRETWESLLPPHDRNLRTVFDRLFPEPRSWPKHHPGPLKPFPSSKSKNVLFKSVDGRFENVVDDWGLGYTYWGWNAKFADLDQDGFQDLYLVNGTFQKPLLTPNLLFLNQQGRGMLRADEEGAVDYFPTANYTYIDLDNDGDLDILACPPNGKFRLFRNNQQRQSIMFELEDYQSLRSGVGAKVTIRYKGGQQLRELKASGGFGSFEAPLAHFGLGDHRSVQGVEVRWSDGKQSVISDTLEAGYRYRLARH